MIYSRTSVLLAVLVVLGSCKLGVKSSDVKTAVRTGNNDLLAFAAVTTLTFRDKQNMPAWEWQARVGCGDKPDPRPSRLDDLVYELIPEAARGNSMAIHRGDSSLCRYQPPTPDNMRLTRDLFADKALAIKVKYLEGYEIQPPPTIRFNSGSAVNVPQERFASLFLGECSEFAMMNGIQFCKTTDRGDGRVIWLALIAPASSSLMPHGGGKMGKGGKEFAGKGVVVDHQQAGKIVGGGNVGQFQNPTSQTVGGKVGKGGKGGVMPVTPSGGRIDMDIALPWMNDRGFKLALDVPNFNHELIAHMQGGGDVYHPPHPPVDPPTTTDLGKKLDRDQIAILVPRPLRDPRGTTGDARLLRLTLKTRPTKPHEGRWSGFIKIGGGVVGGVAAVSLGWWTAPALLVQVGVMAVTGGLALGTGVAGGMDFSKWFASVNDRGAYDDFKVPSEASDCPAIYGTHLTFEDGDIYLTLKSERRQDFVVGWWDNLGDIQFVPISTIEINTWGKSVLEGFTVHYCRKSYEKHCTALPEKEFSDELKTSIQKCSSTDDEIISNFGQH